MTQNSVRDEGAIKYQCHWRQTEPLPLDPYQALLSYRDRTYIAGLIGVYPDGIGYGNISCRCADNPDHFVISGTQTGHIPQLTIDYYARVTAVDLPQNTVTCEGPVKASSESLTHGSIYQLMPAVQGIIHVHHKGLWQTLLNQVPTTLPTVPYGTPEMAMEMERLTQESSLLDDKIFVMAGHEDGVVTFGESLEVADKILQRYYQPLL
ncbi:class II aldolase/adducin family protein [Leptothoe kymatousa]|uniref:Class II aldolase/adducin family protein n=1 Tax=Leptothoe kymatousa TAU-MAC 1615 TaxID=2364775 RepID=A0ABS5Y109_9CYAN|nr:class II aldolase/adducin family protein [Leptothoe kymatousa]MBT9311517.1 class II aldolase/adducin family protein [Leptothoe kymatousa TAU-MAC 1615]